MKLGDLLVQAGCITQEQLKVALAEQKRFGGRLGDILAQKRFCSEDAVAYALGTQLGVPYVDLTTIRSLPPVVQARLPYEVALKHNVVPCAFRQADNALVVAMANPRDKVLIDKLHSQTRWNVLPATAGVKSIGRARARLYGQEELQLEEGEEVRMQDALGRTVRRKAEDIEREHARRQMGQAISAPAVAAAPSTPPQTGTPGRDPFKNLDPVMAAAPAAPLRTDATQAELLATIEALQGEVKALKALALVLFKKGYVTHEEFLAQFNSNG